MDIYLYYVCADIFKKQQILTSRDINDLVQV